MAFLSSVVNAKEASWSTLVHVEHDCTVGGILRFVLWFHHQLSSGRIEHQWFGVASPVLEMLLNALRVRRHLLRSQPCFEKCLEEDSQSFVSQRLRSKRLGKNISKTVFWAYLRLVLLCTLYFRFQDALSSDFKHGDVILSFSGKRFYIVNNVTRIKPNKENQVTKILPYLDTKAEVLFIKGFPRKFSLFFGGGWGSVEL